MAQTAQPRPRRIDEADSGLDPEFGRTLEHHRGAAVEAENGQSALQRQGARREALAFDQRFLGLPLAIVREEQRRHAIGDRSIGDEGVLGVLLLPSDPDTEGRDAYEVGENDDEVEGVELHSTTYASIAKYSARPCRSNVAAVPLLTRHSHAAPVHSYNSRSKFVVGVPRK